TLEESVTIAREFLEQHSLWYPEMKYKKMDATMVDYLDGNGPITENRNIYFSHMLDDLNVNSGDTRVQVGSDGVVEIVAENKKELELIGTYPIITPNKALELANQGKGVYSGAKENAKIGFVKTVNLIYMDNGPFSTFEQYHPVYIMSGVLDSKDSKEKFSVTVRGIDESFFSATPIAKPEEIREKEFGFKNPNDFNLVDLTSPGKNKTLTLTSPEIMLSLEEILQKSNGTIEGYGSIANIQDKTDTRFKSRLEFNYVEPATTSFQFGRNEAKGIKEKDKFGNVQISIKKVVIPMDGDGTEIIIMGQERGFIVKLDSDVAIKKIINSVEQ
ncbi:MAG: hypothetical protein WA125_08985, partial [Desulfosporosinus sp.]